MSFLTAASLNAATRAALVTASGAESLAPLADLVAVELHDNGLELLERQQSQLLLAEQKLSGLSDPANAVAAGKLLSVDIFAVLSTEPGGTALIVFDARSGARLADEVLTGKAADQQATEAATALHGCLIKQKSIVHPVCLLTVRNADLGSSMDRFCDGIGLILQRQLLADKDITILERSYLDQVNKERGLPTSRPSAPLMPSLQFLELEISRGKEPGTYSAAVFVSDSVGNKLGRIDTSANSPGMLVKQLLDHLVEKLGATSPQPPDLDRESMRFAAEADFFRSHHQTADALIASEAAFALRASDRGNQRRLAVNLIEAARASDSIQATLPQAARSLDLCINATRDAKTVHLVDKDTFFETEKQIGYFIYQNKSAQQNQSCSASFESLRITFHDWVIARVGLWAAGAPDAENVQRSENTFWGNIMPELNESANNRAEYAARFGRGRR